MEKREKTPRYNDTTDTKTVVVPKTVRDELKNPEETTEETTEETDTTTVDLKSPETVAALNKWIQELEEEN